jgi:hypothetical protein
MMEHKHQITKCSYMNTVDMIECLITNRLMTLLWVGYRKTKMRISLFTYSRLSKELRTTCMLLRISLIMEMNYLIHCVNISWHVLYVLRHLTWIMTSRYRMTMTKANKWTSWWWELEKCCPVKSSFPLQKCKTNYGKHLKKNALLMIMNLCR